MTLSEALRQIVSDYSAMRRKWQGYIPVEEQRRFQGNAVVMLHTAVVDFDTNKGSDIA